MKYGISKSGTLHLFTNNNECICDLNIKIYKEVSEEYFELTHKELCLNCNNLRNKTLELRTRGKK